MNDVEIIDGLVKWAATQPAAPDLVGKLQQLALADPVTQSSVVGDLMKIDAPLTAPSTTQVIGDKINPFSKPLAGRPQDWANRNALPDFKAGLQSAGTNYAAAIGDVAKQLKNPSGPAEKWYQRVISSPVNAGFSNSVMNVLTNRLPTVKKSSRLPEAAVGLPPATGPEAIEHALNMLDLDHLHETNMAVVRSGKKTRRPDAIRILGLVEGFRRSGIHPKDLMLSRIPVIPPKFRPFNVAGDTFIPGDANELYRDLVDIRDAHGHLEAELGSQGAGHNRINVYDAIKAVYGYGDPVKAKTLERGVSGFLRKITGTSPKFSALTRTLISKPVDYVGRGVIGLDPSLQLDEIGLPEDMAWKLYAPHVQRRLVRAGHSPADAVKAINDRNTLARKYLDMEIVDRPTMYSRAPAWHKFNVVGGTAKIISGKTILINPLVGTGLAADHDGDSLLTSTLIRTNLDLSSVTTYSGAMITNQKIMTFEGNINIQDMPIVPGSEIKKSATVSEWDVPAGVLMYGLDRQTGQHGWFPVTKFSVHRDLEMWDIGLYNKTNLVVSSDHSLVAYREGTLVTVNPEAAHRLCVPKIRKVHTGDRVVSNILVTGMKGVGSAKLPHERSVALDRQFGQFLGLIIGDGWVDNQDGIYLCGAEDDNMQTLMDLTKTDNLNFLTHGDFIRHVAKGFTEHKMAKVRVSCAWFGRWLKQQIGEGALSKRIPSFSLNAPEEHLLGLLDGLLSTDGTVAITRGKKKPQLQINYATSSPDLVDNVRLLGRRLGIRVGVTHYRSSSSHKAAWLCHFSTPDFARMVARTGFRVSLARKQATLAEGLLHVDLESKYQASDLVPYPWHLHKVLIETFKSLWPDAKQRGTNKFQAGELSTSKTRGYWTRTLARQYTDEWRKSAIDRADCREYCELVEDTTVDWLPVVSARKLPGRMEAYDVTIPGPFTFATSEGIVVQDTMNVHVPALPDAVKDVRERLMPSRMLFSIKDHEKVVPVPKHEFVLGLYQAKNRAPKQVHSFPTEQHALSAINAGKVNLSDEVKIG